MITRLDIAKARARVALARLSGEVLPESVRTMATMEFSESPRIRRAWEPLVDLPGIHAGGRDFGSPILRAVEDVAKRPTANDAILVDSGIFDQESLATLRARVARGDLGDLIRRTWQQSVDESLAESEAARRLGIGVAKLRWMVSIRDLFAFVTDGALRFPLWQFTGDPLQPVIPHLSRLVEAFSEELTPTSILGFMTTPHAETQIAGRAVTPIEWLRADGDVERLVELLDSYLM